MKTIMFLILSIALLSISQSCKDSNQDDTDLSGLPVAFSSFSDDVVVFLDGDEVVLRTTNIPDHGSPYFGQGNSGYEAYSGSNPAYIQNPNLILEQDIEFRIPVSPQEAANKSATPFGPIGVSVNGVVFFNQNAAPGDDLSQEINTFDQYNGHPQQSGMYHYHIEPTWLTTTRGSEGLMGFLMDGFPVYGPVEDGAAVTNDDLDAYHGHSHATDEYPEGIYHYHITSESPYINGDGFFGTEGTVSQ